MMNIITNKHAVIQINTLFKERCYVLNIDNKQNNTFLNITKEQLEFFIALNNAKKEEEKDKLIKALDNKLLIGYLNVASTILKSEYFSTILAKRVNERIKKNLLIFATVNDITVK